MTSTPRREGVLQLVREERARQISQYGTNDDLDLGFGSTVSWLAPFTNDGAADVQRRLRVDYEYFVRINEKPTWMHLIREEVAELFEARVTGDVVAEAIQVAALCVSLVEHLLGNEGEVELQKPMTEQEWERVQEALCKGGLRECINDLLTNRDPENLLISHENRRLLERAWDDGDGSTITLVPTDDPPWFAGMHDGHEMMVGLEHEGTLYSIVSLSGGGMVAVIVGSAIIENEMGVAFHSTAEAKAYVQGLITR